MHASQDRTRWDAAIELYIYSSMDAAQPCGDAEGKDWRLMARKQGDVPVIGILTIDDNE